MGRLAARAIPALLASAQSLLGTIAPIELTPAIAQQAAELARSHGLRAYDAVHLASYLRAESPSSVLVAADGDLARAACGLGCTVAVPG